MQKKDDKLLIGNQNHQVNFEEWLNTLALCGHMKYMEVEAQRWQPASPARTASGTRGESR